MASQPTFLYMVAWGCIISSSTILLVSFDDRNFSTSQLDVTCQSSVWFYGLGFGLSISALFAKTYRAKCLTIDKINASKDKHIVVSIYQYFIYVAIALTFEIIICSIWTAVDPLTWTRSCASDTSGYCRSIGTCSSDTAVVFISLLLALHFVFLVYMLWICYQVRNIPAEFAEHKWITASTVSSIEILFLTPFLVYMTHNDPTTSTLIMTLALFFNDLGVLVMIFVPKIFMMLQEHTVETESQENMLFNLRMKVRQKMMKPTPAGSIDSKRPGSTSKHVQIISQGSGVPTRQQEAPIPENERQMNSKASLPEIQVCTTIESSNPITKRADEGSSPSTGRNTGVNVGNVIREHEEAMKVPS
uniref:G-protein coupled receptors family 3 profile domain-containing protein n=1 Tax=Lotharella oceanica TaxID=641309 RepID=A0A7S2U339_9EUKA